MKLNETFWVEVNENNNIVSYPDTGLNIDTSKTVVESEQEFGRHHMNMDTSKHKIIQAEIIEKAKG